MVSLELAIATLAPVNVQAYTLPAAVYIALVGLTMRSRDRLGDNIGWHEVLQVTAAALLVVPQAEQGFEPGGARRGLILLVVPQAEQGFEPGGARRGLILLVEGLVLLGVAVALNTRWLAVSAVVTLSGVALRFLWVNRDSDAVPYWVMLAVAGFVLLAVGLTVLLQREWWDRSRLRLLRRWRQDAAFDVDAENAAPVAALLTPLVPVLVIIAIAVGD